MGNGAHNQPTSQVAAGSNPPAAAKVRVEVVRVGELVEFARDAVRRGPDGGILPIPPHLAAAHSHNPYADADDPGILVAYVGDQCVGHISLVPGMVRIRDQICKVHWGSALYVTEAARQMGVGAALIHRLLSLDIDFVGAEMSRKAEKMWRQLGLTKILGPRRVFTLQIDLAKGHEFRVSGPRATKPFRTVVTRIMTACYPVTRLAIYTALIARFRQSLRDVIVEEVDRLPPEFADDRLPGADESPETRVAFHRGLEWLNWRLAHRWILTDDEVGPDMHEAAGRYYFEVSRPRFFQHAVTFRRRSTGAPLGYVMVSYSARRKGDRRLKILDSNRNLDPDLALVAGLRLGRKHGADAVILSGELGRRLQSAPLGRLLLREGVHEYCCRPRRGSLFANNVKQIELSICDGDYSFT